MGYTCSMFEEIGKMSLPGTAVLDVGSQDLTITSKPKLQQINRFILQHNKSGEKLDISRFPFVIEAREVYIRAGFSYSCIDVDERPCTLRVDLASFQIPKELRNKFDLVVNVGTTEHLSSPVAAFALIHEATKKGGIIYNDVPLFGMGNHGLMNPTPKFWHAMMWMNQYSAKHVTIREVGESKLDRGNFYHDYLSYIKGLKRVKNISYIINAVYEKQASLPFVVPYDAVLPASDNGESLASILYGAYLPFLQSEAYSIEEVLNAINSFLELNDKKYRVESLESFLIPL